MYQMISTAIELDNIKLAAPLGQLRQKKARIAAQRRARLAAAEDRTPARGVAQRPIESAKFWKLDRTDQPPEYGRGQLAP